MELVGLSPKKDACKASSSYLAGEDTPTPLF
jgi:hypothetical protein